MQADARFLKLRRQGKPGNVSTKDSGPVRDMISVVSIVIMSTARIPIRAYIHVAKVVETVEVIESTDGENDFFS